MQVRFLPGLQKQSECGSESVYFFALTLKLTLLLTPIIEESVFRGFYNQAEEPSKILFAMIKNLQ
jgi:hypothetical protein